ncbi:ABC transporter permease [Vibrio sp. PP-XX7]
MREQLGLNQPGIERYLHWLFPCLTGDLSQSMTNNMPVSELVHGRLSNTLMLALVTSMVSVPIALLLGISAAIFRDTRLDKTLNTITVALVAVPFTRRHYRRPDFVGSLVSALSYGGGSALSVNFSLLYAPGDHTLLCHHRAKWPGCPGRNGG